MKKLKFAILITMLLSGGVLAYANRPCQGCMNETLYFFNGSTYSLAGVFGTDYYCVQSAGNCTYYLLDTYYPCQTGAYHSLRVNQKK